MLKRIAFWSLLPFVIPQALHVRRTAPHFAGAKGDSFGEVGKGAPISLLAIGDSIIAGVGASTYDKALVGTTSRAISDLTNKSVRWHAIGQIGATSQKVQKRLFHRVKEENYDVIVVSVGVNDVTALVRSHHWRKHLAALIDKLHDRSPKAVMAIAGIPPLWGFPLLPAPLKYILGIRAKTFDRIIREVANQRAYAIHVPLDFKPEAHKFSKDGYHPSESSYQEFGEAVAHEVVHHSTVLLAAAL